MLTHRSKLLLVTAACATCDGLFIAVWLQYSGFKAYHKPSTAFPYPLLVHTTLGEWARQHERPMHYAYHSRLQIPNRVEFRSTTELIPVASRIYYNLYNICSQYAVLGPTLQFASLRAFAVLGIPSI